jgi:DNA adenine methylase
MSVATNTLIQEKQNLTTIKNFCLLPKSADFYKRRSPFFYVGDKYKIIEQISEHFPKDIKTFIEPFIGGGTVFLNVKAKSYLLNDIDSYLIKLHDFLIQQTENQDIFFKELEKIIFKYSLSRSYLEDIVPVELKKEFKKTYYARFNKKGYLKLRDKFNNDKSNMLELYVLLIYGFNRMLRFNSSGNFNLPVGNVDLNQNVINALKDYFSFVENKSLKLSNLDYIDFISQIDIDNNDFIYLDPPYLISSSEYNKLWNEEEETRLLKFLDNLNKKNVKWAISNMIENNNKTNEMFSNWMLDYNVNFIKSNYISFNNNTIKPIKEVLITNY